MSSPAVGACGRLGRRLRMLNGRRAHHQPNGGRAHHKANGGRAHASKRAKSPGP